MIFTPKSFAKEELLRFQVDGMDHVVISGYANFEDGWNEFTDDSSQIAGGGGDDYDYVPYEIHMEVGPQWLRIVDVSPLVTHAGFGHSSSDEADATGYRIDSCTWDKAGDPNNNFLRVLLVVQLQMRGGPDAKLSRLGYQLMAQGTLAPGFQG